MYVDIEETLRNYKKYKGVIETTEQRCRFWKQCLNNMTDAEIVMYFEESTPIEIGMPRSNRIHKPTEEITVKSKVTREKVESWIAEDTSRIMKMKFDIEQLDTAMKALTDEDSFIIETKYFLKWTWRNIENEFNEKYRKRTKTDIGIERLKRKKEGIIKLLDEIINLKNT